MSLKEHLMVKSFTNVDTATLTAPVGESYLVKGIYLYIQHSTGVRVLIDKTTVGYFYLGGTQGNDLSARTGTSTQPNVLQVLIDGGYFRGYPVASGQTFSLIFDDGTLNDPYIVYEIYDEADIKPTDPNGSLSTDYDVILYGEPSNVVGNNYSKYDTALSPDEFPKFPFGSVVPSNTTITIKGLVHYAVGRTANSGADQSAEQFIKFQKDRIVLFDNDRNGLPYHASTPTSDGVAIYPPILVDYSQTNDANNLFFFPSPLIFNEGDDLDIYTYVNVVQGNQCLESDDLRLGLIATIKSSK